MQECLICKSPIATVLDHFEKNTIHIKCTVCGENEISDEVGEEIKNNESIRLKLKSLLTERKINGYNSLGIYKNHIDNEMNLTGYSRIILDELLNTFPKNIFEKIDRCLVLLSKIANFPGEVTKIPSTYYGLFFAEYEGLKDLSSTYNFMKELNLIEGKLHPEGYVEVCLTIEGLKKVYDLEKKINQPNQVFVAMWFSEEMDSPYRNAIAKAIEENGYIPIRIDKVEHNNKIDDEIIAKIKESKFIVADFTGHRGGVYFEAGYAMGLGLPVIWTCRKDELNNLHFDTRQYSHLVWESEEELFKLLNNRIKATITPIDAQLKNLVKA